MNKQFYVFNTGCIRRGLDGTRIYNYLSSNGWRYTHRVGKADLIVISTCGAVQEKEDWSLHAIRRTLKKKAPAAKLVVSGCLPKINPDGIRALGDVVFVPTGDLGRLDDILDSKVRWNSVPDANTISEETDILPYLLLYRFVRNSKWFKKTFDRFSMRRDFLQVSLFIGKLLDGGKRLLKFSSPQKIVPYYNLSIADGCVGNCTFCGIRFATGNLRSKPIEKIVEELKEGLRQGYRYFQVISEDTGCYGLDRKTTIVDLLRKLLEVPGDYKLILIDFNPRWLVRYYDELLPLLVENQDRIRELFVPVQTGSDRILGLMQRHHDIETLKPMLQEINRKAPKIRLRTTIIVGFPGETTEDFDQTKQIVQDVDWFEVTLNQYEDRPGTKSSVMNDKIPQETIDRRTDELRLQIG